jgi:hypothetical protein
MMSAGGDLQRALGAPGGEVADIASTTLEFLAVVQIVISIGAGR